MAAMKVCLVTTTQPSTNPRLVKEADALVEAGAAVHVIAAHRADWAAEADRPLLAGRHWTSEIVDWRREIDPSLFWRSRLRHFAARKLAAIPLLESLVSEAAVSRIGRDLAPAASKMNADLFIAHNLGALPIAMGAGRRCGVPVGFDAEDFHSGQLSPSRDRALYRATRRLEKTLIPCCAYVTAASPGIAEAYRDLCHIPLPTCVLNVFPLRDRPSAFRAGTVGEPVRLHWFSQTIGPDRGLEDAIRAMGMLTSYRLELHVRGQWWRNYEAEIRRLADQVGVAQAQIVAHLPAPSDDLVRRASVYDVGLALEPPASVNNDILLSNKIFTYLLAGNCVVATRTRGQSALIPELQAAAAWYEPGRPEGLASALRPWLDDRGALAAARETAWRLGETRFNWDREKTKFLDAIARTLRVRASSHRAAFAREAAPVSASS
jgi:glycosyltransferase involved in cell wall biosynthesis